MAHRTSRSTPATTPAATPWSPQRTLTVLAQDPSIRRRGKLLTSRARIAAETLREGPCGARIRVVDYDASCDRVYLPLRGGYQHGDAWRDPFLHQHAARLLDNPHFHQQNVYALAMRTLGHFEAALGRRVPYAFDGHQLHIAPHAFADANAYYQRESRCLSFGYFPGPDGHMVFTCLAHDVVVHEMTHALLDGLRPHFIDPSSPDQAAFHEGFADVVALLSVLADGDIVTGLLAEPGRARGQRPLVAADQLTARALKASALLGLAEQIGAVIPNGCATALRRSVTRSPTRAWRRMPVYAEPHRRGEILVAAIMDAFLAVWIARLRGLGAVVPGYYDAGHVSAEGVTAARHLLGMCIRAIDYTPTTDLQYADYLSALLTADAQTLPDDGRYHYREVLRRRFAAWGIVPASRPDRDGLWCPFTAPLTYRGLHLDALRQDTDEAFGFLWQNAEALGLAPAAETVVRAVRPITRVAPDGLIVRETIVEYRQTLTLRGHELAHLGLKRPEALPADRDIHLHGGGVLVFDDFGRLRYSIGNRVDNLARQQARLDCLAREGFFDYHDESQFSRGFFARLHLARARNRGLPGG